MANGVSSTRGGAKTGGSDWRNNIQFETNDKFFGNIHQVSNKRFQIQSQTPSEDEIILFTNNVAVVKGSPVLITDNNKAVYLKEWNVKGATVEFENDPGTYHQTYAVKLNKKYFKEYTFSSGFDNVSFTKGETFDSLRDVAKNQEKENKKITAKNLVIGTSSFL